MAFPNSDMPITVAAAFGADLTADPATWSYTTISTRLTGDPITKRVGRSAGAQQAEPGSMSLTLDNSDGALTPLNPLSTYYPNVVLGLPIRVTINPTGAPAIWFSGYADSWMPDLIPTTEEGVMLSVVRVTASGILRRLSQGTGPLRSAMYRSMIGARPGDYVPYAYWPMEDGADSTQFANAVAGLPGQSRSWGTSASVILADDSTMPGSEPVPTMPADTLVTFDIPTFANTGQWVIQVAMRLQESNSIGGLFIYAGDNTIFMDYDATGLNVGASVTATGASIFSNSDTITTNVVGEWVSVIVASVDTPGGDDFFCRLLDGQGNTIAETSNTNPGVWGKPRRVQFGSGVNAIGGGHLAFYIDPNFDAETDGIEGARAMSGWAGEMAHERVERLCREEGIAVTITGSSSQTMGPQTTGTLLENLQECETVNTGGLGEDGFGLRFICLPERYNRAVDLTIDLSTYRTAQGTSAQVLRPLFDDQQYRNRWVVNRPEGSEAVADLSEGGLLYEDSTTANVETDAQLADQAWWRAYRDSIVALRYANTPIDLAANSSLINAWLDVVPGLGRIVRTGLPSDHIQDDIDELVDGVSETMTRRTWTVQYSGTPAAAYAVGELDNGDRGRLNTGSSRLATSVSNVATTLTVSTTEEDELWSTSGAQYPADVRMAGEVMTVTAVASCATDAFGRNTSNGWGTADSGQAWTRGGGADADFSTTTAGSATGNINMPTSMTERWMTMDVGTARHGCQVILTTNTLPVGGVLRYGVGVRYVDTSNYIYGIAEIDTSGSITAVIRKRVAGTLTLVDSRTTNLNIANNVLCRVRADDTTIRLWLWHQTDPMPWAPTLTATVSDSALQSATRVGVFCRREGSAPTTVEYDGWDVFNPQRFTVTRSVNGVVKGQSAGATIRPDRPFRLAL